MISFDKRFIQRIRIPLGFLFAILFIVFSRPTLLTILLGGAIAIVGLGIRAWASGHIRKASVLAVSGPYGYTRNPLYLGSLIMGLGFSIAAGTWWLGLLFLALFLGIYWPVMRIEAEDMHRIFPDSFPEYEREVPLLWPRLSVWKRTGETFDSQLYLRYREYRAALGTLGGMLALAVKAFYLH